MNVEVLPFERVHAEQVADLVLSIQQIEFGVPITLTDQPDLQDVRSFFQRGTGNFWVAVTDGKVVGTVGLLDIGRRQFALRKMFVHPEFRGSEKGIARELLATAIRWAEEQKGREILLGTTDRYLAAHRFYEKNGFRRINESELPAAFPRMAVDTVFYVRKLPQEAAAVGTSPGVVAGTSTA